MRAERGEDRGTDDPVQDQQGDCYPEEVHEHVGEQIHDGETIAGAIRSYEKGRAMPSVHTLVRIAVALDSEPGFFLEGLTLDQFDAPERRRAG